VFGSLRCDCGEQLEWALSRIAAEGRGVLVYLRGHEGRGIGLASKISAYSLQDSGMDTVDANTALGLPVDARVYDVGAAMLRDLGVESVKLMSNNPKKLAALEAAGLPVVERIPHAVEENPENRRYLATKRQRLGHLK
jgi:GTP cyclohydrolase II